MRRGGRLQRLTETPAADPALKLESRLRWICPESVDFGHFRLPSCAAMAILAAFMVPTSKTVSTPPEAPERSLDQRMDALKRANNIRTARAQLKRDLKAGRKTIIEVLDDPPEYLLTAKVFDMLLAVPKYGRVKANRVLKDCKVSPAKTIGGLSDRQRKELVNLLRR